jgi:hypothetical protein
MGRIIIPPRNVLNWLADTIRNYYGQLEPDWTTESDHFPQREPSAPSQFNYIKLTPMSEYGCDNTIANEQGFRNAVEIFICSRDYEDLCGY